MPAISAFISLSLDGCYADANSDMSWAYNQDPEQAEFTRDNAKGGATREALDDIRRILASREALYARADAVVDTAARTVKQSLKDLERAVAGPN